MPGPLDGVLVVDLSRALAGPHAAMMLGDLGARVIKVENPDGGDDSRGWGPPFVGADGRPTGESTYFFSCNRNKESVTADLKSDDGKALLTRLVRQADVLVENFRTGVLDRLGFSVERLHELNPRLVVLSITGFGHDGPEGGRAGYDQIAQGEAGLMSLTGTGPDDPMRVGVPIGDLLAGMYGAYGVVAALHERDATGRGQVVRTSLLAAIVGVHAFQGTRYTVAGEVPHGAGQPPPVDLPVRAVPLPPTALVQIAVGSEGLWRRLRRASSTCRPTTRGSRPTPSGSRNRDAVIAAVDAAFADAAARRPAAAAGRRRDPGRRGAHPRPGLRLGPDPSQGLLIDVEHAHARPVTLPGPPLRSSTATSRATPPAAADARPARRVGARLAGRRSTAGAVSSPGALELIEAVLDAGSWRAGTTPLDAGGRPDPAYAEALAPPASAPAWTRPWSPARAASAAAGSRCVACEFGFLAGSIGVAAAERLVRAVERATDERLPLLAVADLRRHPDAGGHRRVPADGQDHRGDRPAQGRGHCRTSSTCATRRPAACSPRGARSAMSPSPSRAR